MLYYAVVGWHMNATKGWNRKKVVIEHVTKRFGKDEKIHLCQNLVSCDVDCVACGLQQINT